MCAWRPCLIVGNENVVDNDVTARIQARVVFEHFFASLPQQQQYPGSSTCKHLMDTLIVDYTSSSAIARGSTWSGGTTAFGTFSERSFLRIICPFHTEGQTNNDKGAAMHSVISSDRQHKPHVLSSLFQSILLKERHILISTFWLFDQTVPYLKKDRRHRVDERSFIVSNSWPPSASSSPRTASPAHPPQTSPPAHPQHYTPPKPAHP